MDPKSSPINKQFPTDRPINEKALLFKHESWFWANIYTCWNDNICLAWHYPSASDPGNDEDDDCAAAAASVPTDANTESTYCTTYGGSRCSMHNPVLGSETTVSLETSTDITRVQRKSSSISLDDVFSSSPSSSRDYIDERTSTQSLTTVENSPICATTSTDDEYQSSKLTEIISPRSEVQSLQWDNTGMDMAASTMTAPSGSRPGSGSRDIRFNDLRTASCRFLSIDKLFQWIGEQNNKCIVNDKTESRIFRCSDVFSGIEREIIQHGRILETKILESCKSWTLDVPCAVTQYRLHCAQYSPTVHSQSNGTREEKNCKLCSK